MDSQSDKEASGSEESTYIYLDFNGKLPNDVFQNEVFFRIANLHKNNPLVQVKDYLFKGTYGWSIGTNLFFEEREDNPHIGNTFEKQRPIPLRHFISTTKLLNLQQVKIPQAKAKIQNEVKHINYNLTWNYDELLKKLENLTLRIEDIFASSAAAPTENIVEEEQDNNDDDDDDHIQSINAFVEPETRPDRNESVEVVLEEIAPSKILEAEYLQLSILASRPVKRAISPELVADCEEKYKEAFDYHNIERKILQPRDGFKHEMACVNEETLFDCIDIDRCVLYGLISHSSNFPRILSKEEKEKLLTLENFDNLSLAGRYYVLQNTIKNLEEYINNAAPSKLQDRDEYGRTAFQTLEIYKKLADAVRNRLQQIKRGSENEE